MFFNSFNLLTLKIKNILKNIFLTHLIEKYFYKITLHYFTEHIKYEKQLMKPIMEALKGSPSPKYIVILEFF